MDPLAMQRFLERYGIRGRPSPAAGAPAAAADQPAAFPGEGAAAEAAPTKRKAKGGDTNEVASLTLTFRAVSLKNSSGQPDADKGVAYSVLQELQNSPFFDPDPQETHTTSEVTNDDQTGTFTFSIVARLKHSLKL
jgi:hypothetical protein